MLGVDHVAFRTAAAGAHESQQTRPAANGRNRHRGLHWVGTTPAGGPVR
jgi:hypothetical protein